MGVPKNLIQKPCLNCSITRGLKLVLRRQRLAGTRCYFASVCFKQGSQHYPIHLPPLAKLFPYPLSLVTLSLKYQAWKNLDFWMSSCLWDWMQLQKSHSKLTLERNLGLEESMWQSLRLQVPVAPATKSPWCQFSSQTQISHWLWMSTVHMNSLLPTLECPTVQTDLNKTRE